MTTNDFTEAARAEAERRWPRVARRNKTAEEWLAEGMALGFVSGAEWGRDQALAEEPTDKECIAILNAVTTPFGENPGKSVWAYAAIRRCREAIMEARRKEYK